MAPLTVPVRVNIPSMPWLPAADMYIKIAEFVFSFIVVFCMIPVLITETKYLGVGSAGPSWTTTVAILSLPFPAMMAFFPYMYDRYDRFKSGAKVFGKPRTNAILTGFWSVMWFTVVITITVHTLKPDNCQWDESLDKGSLMNLYGDTYAHDWVTQCYAAKAGAAFAWIEWLLWLASLLIGLKMFWEEKQLKNTQISAETQEKAAAAGRRADAAHNDEAASYRRQEAQPAEDDDPSYAEYRSTSFDQSRPLNEPHEEAYGSPEPTHYGSPVPPASYYSPPPEHNSPQHFGVEFPTPHIPAASPESGVTFPDHQAYVGGRQQPPYVPPPSPYGGGY